MPAATVAGWPPELRLGHRFQTKLRRGGSPQENQPTVPCPADKFRILGRNILYQPPAAVGTRVTRLLLGEVLEQQGHAGKNRLLGEVLCWRLGELRIADRIKCAVHAGCPLNRCLAYFP